MEEKEPKLESPAVLSKKVKNVRSKRVLFLSRLKRKIVQHVWLMRGLIILAVLGVLAAILIGLIILINSFGFGRYTHLARTFLFTPESKIQAIAGRTNILILGKGGSGHEAPDLTDTMIFASISHTGSGMNLVSLPRDIWIPALRAKLNSTYYWGNKKTEGGGLILAKATVEEIVGEPIHYGLVLDFSGLTRVIDVLGGVEVDVAAAFVDEKYPVVGREGDLCGGDKELKCRYETLKFNKGPQTMNGETALKFVRSRNAEGDEGTDFARASRQQKVIDAIESKLLSRDVVLSPNKIKQLISLFEEVTETDIDEEAGAILARRLFDARDKRRSYVLGEQFLENPPLLPKYDRLYVFIPKGRENWGAVHEWIDSLK